VQVHYETMTTPLPELIDEAVTASRLLRSADEYEAVWVPLRKAAEAGAAAIDTGLEMLGSGDPVIRATGCDLLGTVFNGSDEPRRAVAAALVELAGRESDPDVLWSVAGALHFASDPIAIPILIGLAAHPDSNVRFQTAHALTSAMADHPNDKGVEALLRLTADRYPEVRNWATFGLGRQMEIDGPEIRDALWARVGDSYEDVRVEGICGLARRHDRRALSLVADLLAQDDQYVWVFAAATWLADESLLPLLERYERDTITEPAIIQCDPARRAVRDEICAQVLRLVQAALDERRPRLTASLSCDVWDYESPILNIDPTDGGKVWYVVGVLEMCAGDPDAAARRIIDQLPAP